jgi:peptidoglycan/xylan/chitin deacetylase (PgdA/CDA1 family)
VSGCIDVAAAYIAKYKDDQSAAASYTFDDGYTSSAKIAAIFEEFGWRATFYVVAKIVETRTGWDFWKSIAGKGHEIGNHSLTHTRNLSRWLLSSKTLDEEINGAKALITEKLGIAPATFAFPWHKYSARAMSVASKSHCAVRKLHIRGEKYAFAFFDQDHETSLDKALSTANKQLADIVETGGWFVASGHGVDGDGWSPVTSQFLLDHLAYANKLSPKLWIDTFANVARYRQCRDLASLVVISQSSKRANVQLLGNCKPGWCTPLTVVVPVKESSQGFIKVCDAEGNAIDSVIHSGKLLFNMLPGAMASIEIVLNEHDSRFSAKPPQLPGAWDAIV